jgi:steroid delta-isomerase-like uncharacterized protein
VSSEDIKRRARAFIDAFNRGDLAGIETLLSEGFKQHSPGVPPSREAFFQFLNASFKAFPDGQFEIEDMIAEDDKVLVRWTFRGKHTGVWLYRPEKPTGKSISFSGMDLWRYDQNGKLAEAWFIGDTFGLMKQLGRLPDNL